MVAILVRAVEDIFFDNINDCKTWWTFYFEKKTLFGKKEFKVRNRLHYTFKPDKYIGRKFDFNLKKWE
jgi:hypothetical protein